MHEICLELCYMKWVPGEPDKEILNQLFFRINQTRVLFNEKNT